MLSTSTHTGSTTEQAACHFPIPGNEAVHSEAIETSSSVGNKLASFKSLKLYLSVFIADLTDFLSHKSQPFLQVSATLFKNAHLGLLLFSGIKV